MAKAWEVGGSFTPGTTARRSWPRLSFQAAGRRAGGAPRIPEGPAWQRTARAPGDPICSGTGSTTGGPGPDDDVAKPNSANRLALIIQYVIFGIGEPLRDVKWQSCELVTSWWIGSPYTLTMYAGESSGR